MSSKNAAANDYSTPYKGEKPSATGPKPRTWQAIATDTYMVRWFGEKLTAAKLHEASSRDDAIWQFVRSGGESTGTVFVVVGADRVPTEVDLDAKQIRRPRR